MVNLWKPSSKSFEKGKYHGFRNWTGKEHVLEDSKTNFVFRIDFHRRKKIVKF